MAPITPHLSAATSPTQSFCGYKSKRSEQDRDARTLSSRKCRRIVTNSVIPDKQLVSERRIEIVAKQISRRFNEAVTFEYTSENLLALFYIAAHSSKYPSILESKLKKDSEELLKNLDISQRAIVYKVLPLMDGEFGKKMRFVAAPILYHIPKNFDCKVHFRYSVREILSEGLELSQNLLKCSKDEIDFLCEKLEIKSLKRHSTDEKKLCIETWNRSLSARITLLNHGYEIQLSKYECLEVHDRSTQPPTYKSTQLFNVNDYSRPNQVGQSRNPAWFFSTVIEGLNVERKSDGQGCVIEELRIAESLIKMTEGGASRPTFSLLSTLHETLEGSAKNAIETINKTFGLPEAFQLPYTACNLEFDFLKGRMPNLRPRHWEDIEEPTFLQTIPSWSFLSEILAANRYLQRGITYDIPAEDQDESSDQPETPLAPKNTSKPTNSFFGDSFVDFNSTESGFDDSAVRERISF